MLHTIVTIVYDRGTAFTSQEFQNFLLENNVKHVKIATGSPKANGQVERVNRVLYPMLAKLSDDASGKYWYKVLTDVEFALNNTVQKTTGETPSLLLFGVDQRGNVVDVLGECLQHEQSKDDRNPKELRDKAKDKINKSQEYNKTYFDQKRKEPYKYKEGDYKPSITQKPYTGTWEACNIRPWQVTEGPNYNDDHYHGSSATIRSDGDASYASLMRDARRGEQSRET
ncbi:uncharacterized protein LOC124407412 [Diprion similis]|uniref:uncharacterized protein LOC124407412 n=1 Tax=Diprion similis TaxID=362088 RepID=UPI001EF97B08|nr:uncharacterized protein LOC124407412 [Diprion similis]